MINNLLFNYYSISLLVGGIIAIISGFVVYLNDKNRLENQAWLLLTISTSVWSFGYFLMITSSTLKFAWTANYILHVAAILIPVSYLLLVLTMTKFTKHYKYIFYGILFILFGFMSIVQNKLFVSDLIPKVSFNFAPVPGVLYKYFFAYFVAIVMFGIILSLLKAIQERGEVDKYRYIYLIYFTLFASIGGGSVFLTTFFSIPPYPIILFSIYPFISGYGILKHQLFDIKMVTTHFITFSLWMIILIRVFFSNSTTDLTINILLFVVSVFFGMLLIKNISKEVRIQEQLKKSFDELTAKNVLLKELDQKKSEFMSLATHQLRAPLTSMRGYSSMILDGTFGKVNNPEVEDAIDKISRASTDLAMIVEDYLNISRIEQGRMQYNFSIFNLSDLIKDIIKEVKPTLDHAGLAVNFIYDEAVQYRVNVDQGKIKQVLFNIIDNAIKYTPTGHIDIVLSIKDDNKVLVKIQDTGVGIKPDILPTLFKKFKRAPDASKTNILGTGLGLYVANEILKAHNATAWAESEGQGKGSSFYVELGLVS